MTTTKQPQAGEWWQSQNKLLRVFVIGIAPDGVPVVCEQDLDPYRGPNLAHYWQHLPDCTGWDWQPEVWPKWYARTDDAISMREKKKIAYHRYDSPNSGETFHTDGTSFTFEHATEDSKKIEVTEAEALARVTPPETFPQYWTAINNSLYAYCERFAADKYRLIMRDGTVGPDSPWFPDSGRDRKQITKEEAEALAVTPQVKITPVESPDDWVTQDRVPPRDEIDEYLISGLHYVWQPKKKHERVEMKHGDFVGFNTGKLQVRCRRKDLPVMPQPKRVPVRLVCSTEDIGSVNWRMHDDPGIAGETEIKHDGYKFYVEVQS
jgi:hypothetical protein